MEIKNHIKSVMALSGVSMIELNNRLNNKRKTSTTVSTLSQKINNESLRYSDALEIAEVLGYRIEWVKKD